MSQLPPSDAPNPALVRRRPAGVQLRKGDAQGPSADTANAALGDALRIVYRFLQLGMVILVGVFLLSGLQSIKEGERGVRLALGKVVADDLTPGFQISLPRPLGEIIKINTGNQSFDVRDEFWPSGPSDQKFKEDAVLANMGRGKLDPIQDGFLLIGDLSIGHVVAKVEYGRDPNLVKEYARRIHPDAEKKIVRAAVMQGLVRAAAGVTIDQFRKENAVQANASAFAQKALSDLGSGLQIRSFVLERRMVPANLIKTFNEVESSLSNASKAVSEAEQYRQATLAGVAGDAADDVLTLIDRFDAQSRAGKTDQAEGTLKVIDSILEGGPIPEGQGLARPGARLAGKASQTLTQARSERTRVVSQAQANAELFKAKHAAFKTNPGVVLVGDWADAYSRFIARENVQVFLVPPGVSTLDLLINRDQDLQKAQEAAAAKKKKEEEFKQDYKKLDDRKLESPAGGSAPQ